MTQTQLKKAQYILFAMFIVGLILAVHFGINLQDYQS